MTKYRYKIHDKLYDLTEFVKIHPGGQDMFNNFKPDTDITPMIYTYHKNPKSILTILPKYEVPMSDNIVIQYDTNYSYNSYCELKKLVYDEIQEKKIPVFWTNQEIAYNACMLSIYLGTWGYSFWSANNISYWWMIFLSFMSIGFGALVFHETSHYTGFKNQMLNNVVSHLLIAPFITTKDWKYIHNYLHHSFTNTEYDSDFEDRKYIIRYSNNHIHNFYHKFQYIYAYILFCLGALSTGPLNSIKNKRWNILLFFIILYRFSYINITILYGLSGVLLLVISQLSHIQHECIQINTEKKNDFLYNQVISSMNYKIYDPITRFICFGLDIQIEHHLFPNIPHSSLRKLQHIVRNYCNKNDIPYIEKSGVISMIYSYTSYLYNIGNP